MSCGELTSSSAPYRSDSSAAGVSEAIGSEMSTVGFASVSGTLTQQSLDVLMTRKSWAQKTRDRLSWLDTTIIGCDQKKDVMGTEDSRPLEKSREEKV